MEPETIDISLGAIDDDMPKSSSNFGGIELLMNEKVKETSSSPKPDGDIDTQDLADLEQDLNNLSDDIELPHLSNHNQNYLWVNLRNYHL